ncbi:response regulator transcription factor [Stenotrophobium rhamnosiphilum]|uniref:HTH luxR-type domain-containing protein n=1 Tax=Stenotrophobium rhamnosiphilum TaxID=2029166 RepID=A0A2T5MB96_9GAMM|nr:helix-turn-helix transcriptional regulator [Stenotrophobium rhamnosiphilum]PTU28257.1 hypothetical protein CJD38_17640 [Stenotrophobium rhamnosiphilum]
MQASQRIADQRAVQRTRSETQPLTEREVEILALMGKGLSVKGVAQTLGISPGTVTWHAKNSYIKLGACSREVALRKARAQKIIEGIVVCEVCACAMASRSWVSVQALAQA